MKDEGVDDSDWLLFHRGQPEFFLLALIVSHQAFILHLSAFILNLNVSPEVGLGYAPSCRQTNSGTFSKVGRETVQGMY